MNKVGPLCLLVALFAEPALAGGGDLFVTSDASNTVRHYSGTSGAFQNNFLSSNAASGELGIHFGLTNNRVLVGHFIGGVEEFNATTGAYIKTYNPGGGTQWAGLYAPNGNVLIGDWNTNDVREYNSTTGAFVQVLTPVTSPADMRIGPNGNLFICSFNAGFVMEVNATTGAFVSLWNQPPNSQSNDIAFNPNGEILVTAMVTNVVYRYDGAHNLLGSFSGTGWNRPHGIEFSPWTGNVLVADGVTQQVHEFDPTNYVELNPAFLVPGPGDKIVDIDFCPDLPIQCKAVSGECCAGRPDFSAAAYASFGSLVSVGTASPQAVGSAVVAVFDLVNPNGGPFNTDFGAPIYADPSWSESNLGSVFGVTLDPSGNIYVASTTCYFSDVIGTLGGSGTFGKVYKINSNTSVASLFVTLPNTGPQLGNLCYDCEHAQFFVSNMDDGKIYRVNAGGVIQNSFDFGASDVSSNFFAPLGDRIWAVQKHAGRLYFSVWWEDAGNPSTTQANEIWSIALDGSGDFTGAPQLEISMPPLGGMNYSNPVSDMRFSPTGTMFVAERGMDDETTPRPHEARLLEFECVNGAWTPSGNTFSVGVFGAQTNSAGGVDMDHAVAGRVYVTGDALQLGPQTIYGTQGLPATGGTVASSILVDYNGNLTNQDKTFIGDVAVPCRPCLPPPPNMALWLPFDETSGGIGAVTVNLINTAGNGTLAGPGAASLGSPGEVDRAVCFDQGQVNVPYYSSMFLNNDFTIDAWIRPSPQAPPNWKYTIVDKRQFVGLSWRGFWMYLDGAAGTLTLEFSDLGAVNTATGPAVPLNSLWQHVAITLKRNCGGAGNVCVDFWHNGVQGTPAFFSGVTAQIGNTAPLRVADDLPSNTDKWFLGCLDELEIFGRALSHAEILRIYAAFEEGKCKSPPPVFQPNCFPGEGGVIACPCGNPPAGGGLGCNNFGAGPAQSGTLTATGTASLSADTVVLLATGENNTSLTVFWTGLNPKSATGVPHGAGVRCVTSQLRRLYTHSALRGAVSAPAGGEVSVSARTAQVYGGTPIGPGETRKYFTIYRDPQAAGPCGATSSTVNLTNSGGITWEP